MTNYLGQKMLLSMIEICYVINDRNMLILPYTSESWGVESMLYNSKYHVSTTTVSFSLHKRYTATQPYRELLNGSLSHQSILLNLCWHGNQWWMTSKPTHPWKLQATTIISWNEWEFVLLDLPFFPPQPRSLLLIKT